MAFSRRTNTDAHRYNSAISDAITSQRRLRVTDAEILLSLTHFSPSPADFLVAADRVYLSHGHRPALVYMSAGSRSQFLDYVRHARCFM